ncbi:hypothetical protein AAZX31_15G248900 [Glycine max]
MQLLHFLVFWFLTHITHDHDPLIEVDEGEPYCKLMVDELFELYMVGANGTRGPCLCQKCTQLSSLGS